MLLLIILTGDSLISKHKNVHSQALQSLLSFSKICKGWTLSKISIQHIYNVRCSRCHWNVKKQLLSAIVFLLVPIIKQFQRIHCSVRSHPALDSWHYCTNASNTSLKQKAQRIRYMHQKRNLSITDGRQCSNGAWNFKVFARWLVSHTQPTLFSQKLPWNVEWCYKTKDFSYQTRKY